MAGLLVIMGSGETAPTMVKPHRAVFERVGGRPAALLDTPYGFQENADDFATADWIRERLDAAGVEVRDAKSGATWHLR